MRVNEDWYLLEAKTDEDYDYKKSDKSVVKLKKDTMKQIVTTYAKNMNPKRDAAAYNRARKAYGTDVERFRGDMQDMLMKYRRGEMTHSQFAFHAKKAFSDMYTKAFGLGAQSSGMGDIGIRPSDRKWLDKFKKTEFGFLNKFIADMEKGKGSMDYSERLNMYVNTIDSLFDAGRVDAYPDDGTKVYWRLGAAEHCPDCIALAMRSPFTPKTLPTTPRAGDTRCLSHCKCSLSIKYVPPQVNTIEVTKVPIARAKELVLGNALTECVDWNALDTVMGLLLEHKIGLDNGADVYLVEETLREVETASQLAEISPTSEEFFVLHEIGGLLASGELP